ncbi:MAG: hypothetical protein EBY20_11945, partial [Alphaproteobacteria bacterium]|nr:hypothetical protein [Alphaproteobacteria bacterium]
MVFIEDNIATFFYQLHDLGFSIWLENDKLKYRQYKEHANKNEVLNKIKQNKANLVKFLSINNCYSPNKIDQNCIYRFNNNWSKLSFAQERLWFIEKYEEG